MPDSELAPVPGGGVPPWGRMTPGTHTKSEVAAELRHLPSCVRSAVPGVNESRVGGTSTACLWWSPGGLQAPPPGLPSCVHQHDLVLPTAVIHHGLRWLNSDPQLVQLNP